MAWTNVTVTNIYSSATTNDNTRFLWSLPLPRYTIGLPGRRGVSVGIADIPTTTITDIYTLFTVPDSETSESYTYMPVGYYYFPTDTYPFFDMNYFPHGGGASYGLYGKASSSWSIVNKPTL